MRCANPRPTPIGCTTRCATAAFRGRPYRFPNSPRQVVVPASDVLGCPVHRVQALELGPDELVAVGRDAECFTLAHAVQWHCERRVLLNGNVVVFR